MSTTNKEPIYKKWWAWAGLFIIIATFINAQEAREKEAVISNVNENVYDSDHDQPIEVGIDDYEASVTDSDVVLACCQQNTVFRVGSDIPPGEYFIQAKEGAHALVQVSTDGSGYVGSIISNKLFTTHSFITLFEGEYLIVERATIERADEADVPTFSDGILGDGVYRVGKDIPAGIYQIQPTTDVAGYYQISSDSRGTASEIISNSNFSHELTITLEEGQYLTLTRAQLIQQ